MEVKIYTYYLAIKLITILNVFDEVNAKENIQIQVPMLMPNVQPTKNETYLCTAFEMPKDDYQFIVEFKPSVSELHLVHISIFGCSQPGQWKVGSPDHVWDCRNQMDFDSGYPAGPVCYSSSPQYIYNYLLDGVPFKLPPGVGFKVGKGTGIKYLVLQVHYYSNVKKSLERETDNIGVVLTILPSSTNKITKFAGIYLLEGGGQILPKQEKDWETACRIKEHKILHPFAFQVHTHYFGTMVSGYKIDKFGKWQLIGKQDPLKLQNFYPVVDKNMMIEYGDILASRCTYYNSKNDTILNGLSYEDEMCRFYVMYYVEKGKLLNMNTCYAPPEYDWNKDYKIDYIPPDIDKIASHP